MSSSSHILMIGGTGRVGGQVITDALFQGHKVTALVRKPNSIPPQTNLSLITGSPTSTPDILKALIQIAATSPSTRITIISTLGQTRANPSNPWSTPTSPAMFMTESARALVAALRTLPPTLNATIDKLIVLSVFGVGDSRNHLHWSLRWVMAHSNMRQTLEDHEGVVDTIATSFASVDDARGTQTNKLEIPFVVLRCPMLKFDVPCDPRAPVAAVSEFGNGKTGLGVTSSITVSSLSRFLVARVGDDGRLDRTMPVISN